MGYLIPSRSVAKKLRQQNGSREEREGDWENRIRGLAQSQEWKCISSEEEVSEENGLRSHSSVRL